VGLHRERIERVTPQPPIVPALVAALCADPDALDQLATALAPRLASRSAVDTTSSPDLTPTQAARHAGVHDRTIRRALAAGTLRGRTVAGRWRVAPDDLDAWLDAGAPTSTTQTHHNGRPRRTTAAGVDAIAGRSAA
jgi:excisionase family DNA binding protein